MCPSQKTEKVNEFSVPKPYLQGTDMSVRLGQMSWGKGRGACIVKQPESTFVLILKCGQKKLLWA